MAVAAVGEGPQGIVFSKMDVGKQVLEVAKENPLLYRDLIGEGGDLAEQHPTHRCHPLPEQNPPETTDFQRILQNGYSRYRQQK